MNKIDLILLCIFHKIYKLFNNKDDWVWVISSLLDMCFSRQISSVEDKAHKLP